MPVIETQALTKFYGKSRGIEDVSIIVEEGDIFGFIGPNGAGKSTTIRALLNFIYPSSGSATIFNLDCIKKSLKIKAQIGYVPSEINYYKDMRVKELLNYSSSFYKFSDASYLANLYERFELEPYKKIGELSLGNRKKVAILQALLHKPRLLILDEPTTGLDPLMQIRLFEILSNLNKRGTTIFMSSHNLSEVQRLCSKIAIIKEGKIIETKKTDELIEVFKRRITLKTKDMVERELFNIGVKDLNKISGAYVFIYQDTLDKLIKALSKFTIEDMLVEEPSLEDKFLHYYDKEVQNT